MTPDRPSRNRRNRETVNGAYANAASTSSNPFTACQNDGNDIDNSDHTADSRLDSWRYVRPAISRIVDSVGVSWRIGSDVTAGVRQLGGV